MNIEQKCYGNMFPSVVEMTYNSPIAGRVFGYDMQYSGQVAQRRSATVNNEAWKHCLKCPDLDACYRLSIGKMLMEVAIKAESVTQY